LTPTNSETVEGDSRAEKIHEDIDWNNYINEYNTPARINFEAENRESTSFEAFTASKTSLSDHLLWQLLMTSPTPEEEQIGSQIVGNLNKDGYLDVSIEELCVLSGAEPEDIDRVLNGMQTFNPVGVCARDLKECLLIQLKHVGLDQTVAAEIIENHLNYLENKNYKAIARALKVSIDDVISAVNVIKTLEPKPARQFTDQEPQYITPDIYVSKFEDDYVIMLSDGGTPKLRISSLYKKAMNGNGKFSGSDKEYIKDKLRSASWLIRSIHQRQQTIYKVMESIVQFQRDFFEKGIAYLKPMVLSDVAQDIGMHRSTISRATTNKYTHTPRGMFELKYFFNSSINRVHGAAIASASVQGKIKQIIESEDPKKPFSDNKISKLLEEVNIEIARRTVTKYRERLKILPASKRKQFY
jgi:RNA polymerase sigma-54 factor